MTSATFLNRKKMKGKDSDYRLRLRRKSALELRRSRRQLRKRGLDSRLRLLQKLKDRELPKRKNREGKKRNA